MVGPIQSNRLPVSGPPSFTPLALLHDGGNRQRENEEPGEHQRLPGGAVIGGAAEFAPGEAGNPLREIMQLACGR